MHLNIKVRGYVLGAVAAATYGMNPLFALPLYAEGMNADSVLFFRYLLALPVLALMLAWRRRTLAPGRGNLLALAAMGAVFAISSVSLFESYRHMAVGIASTLLFVYPLMVAVIMVAFYKERLTMVMVAALLLATGGIALLYQGGDTHISAFGTMLVFVSALSYAIYIVYVNHSRLRHVPTIAVTFYVLLFGWATLALKIMLFGSLTIPCSAGAWLNVSALAIFPTAISLLCTTAAIHDIGSTPTAILGALEPVTAVVIGTLVFGEALTLRVFAGLVLIVVAVSLVVAGGGIRGALLHFRKMFPSLRHRRPRM